ncbi:NAD(P)/FAD-dependent oxidoreductase [Rhodococcus aerolatus]
MPTQDFDVIVLGGGPVGENAASRAQQGGLTVAMVESELVGGECSYWACMPSKALIRTSQAVAAARRVQGATAELDAEAVLARRTSFTSGWDDSSQVEWAEGAGITVVRGHGRLDGPRRVVVQGAGGDDTGDAAGTDGSADTVLTARVAVVIATGSVPTEPPIDGLDSARHWGSREATSAREVPRRLAVLGTGVVGSELAQAWRRLGSEVTLIGRGERVLASVEPAASDLVREAFEADGITLHLGTGTTAVHRDDDGVHVTLDDGTVVDADELLVATGRGPATADVGAESVGLTAGDPFPVDDSGLVQGLGADAGEGWLYACGDVTGRAPLTHQGKYQARAVGSAIVARHRGELGATEVPAAWARTASTADHGAVPQVVFTDPEVASVGRTAAQAEQEGLPHRVVEIDIAVGGSALWADGYTGKATMVIDTERDVVLGVTLCGQDVGELIHAGTVAVVGEVPLDRLWHAVPSYPTISEVWLRLLEAAGL